MRTVLCTVLALAFTATLAADASARSGSCLAPGSSARCSLWTGKVTFVGDADTIYVDVAGDGTRRTVIVRLTGINAMEQTVYSSVPSRRRGECHALEATSRLEHLIRSGGGRVRLAAQDPSSMSRRRWRRAVAVKIGGRWRDVGRVLVAEGHALWLASSSEYAWNAEYSRLAEQAAATQRGLWNPAYCGAGPSAASPLRLTVNADADGLDREFVNGEWVRIRNLDPVNDVHLGGWMLRDSATHRYRFPEFATLAPGETLTVHVGRGTDTWTDLYWGLGNPVFDNVDRGGRGIGDGAFLFDPQGDLRASMTYPCRLSCSDPNQGALELTATPRARGRERVTVRNVGAAAVDLDGYRLDSAPHVYPFAHDSLLAPGAEMEIEVTGDPAADTALLKHWGKARPILNNSGDSVRLSNLRGVELACFAYGAARC